MTVYINGVAIIGDMFKAVYDANDNGRVEKDAFGITLNKLLKGAGIGVNPTEIDVPAGTPTAVGTYAGNSAADRAIPHGLGATPKMVFIVQNDYRACIIQGSALLYTINGLLMETKAISAMDATDFHVGHADDYDRSMNNTGSTYYWAAIG